MARGRRVRTATTAGPRSRPAVIAAALGLTLAAAGCGTTVPMGAATESPTAGASIPASTLAAERNAVTQLQDWLLDPHGGTLTYNTIQVTGGGTANVMTILSGPFDPAGTANLSGSIETFGSGATTTVDSAAIEWDQQVYTTLPAALQTGDRADKQWASTAVPATWAGNAVRSGWWQMLYQTRDLKLVGVQEMNDTSVDVFTEVLDLSKLSDIPSSLLGSAAVRKAGTTKVEVDVYASTGSGSLFLLTYKLGLPVALDVSATATSTAGYEVDLSGLGNVAPTASASPSPSASAPPPETVAKGAGDGDLAAMLVF